MSDPETSSPAETELNRAQAAYKPPGASLLYQLSLLPVCLIMVLLPVLYVALLAMVSYGVYYHGKYNFHRIMSWGGRIMSLRFELVKILIYITPLFAGIILVFFMVKPLFARRGRKYQPYSLNPEMEPRLFAFISEVCQMIGAPPPRRIDLDCNVNACAYFRRGFLSFFGRDLVLTLGLPLVGALSAEEFAAVLAHEFGHFRQGIGMRLSYIIASINNWFARVVFQRDAWDEMLDDWERDGEGAFAFIFVAAAKLGVLISRLILQLFMMLGRLISSAMERQQEFNADAHAIHAVGSEVFERMLRRLSLLIYANSHCVREMKTMWDREHVLPDNFPLFLAGKVEVISDGIKTRIDDRLGLQRTGPFAAHPADADRIRQARRLAAPGFIRSPAPAAALFENFPAPAQFVTLFYYQSIGIPTTREFLRPTAPSKAERAQAQVEVETMLDKYFYGMLPVMHPVSVSAKQLAPPADAAAARHQIKDFRLRFAAVAGQVADVVKTFSEASERETEAGIAAALVAAECAFEPGQFHLGEPSIAAARVAFNEAVEAQQKCRRSLKAVSEELQQHFAGTLALLHSPDLANAIEGAENLRGETRALAAFLQQFAGFYPLLEQCRSSHASLVALCQQQVGGVARLKISAEVRRLTDLLYKLREAAVPMAVPDGRRKSSGNLFDRYAGGQVDSTDPQVVCNATGAVVNGFTDVYKHCLGRLAQIATQIESTF